MKHIYVKMPLNENDAFILIKKLRSEGYRLAWGMELQPGCIYRSNMYSPKLLIYEPSDRWLDIHDQLEHKYGYNYISYQDHIINKPISIF